MVKCLQLWHIDSRVVESGIPFFDWRRWQASIKGSNKFRKGFAPLGFFSSSNRFENVVLCMAVVVAVIVESDMKSFSDNHVSRLARLQL